MKLGGRDSNPDKQIQSPFQHLLKPEIYLNTNTHGGFRQAKSEVGVTLPKHKTRFGRNLKDAIISIIGYISQAGTDQEQTGED